MSCEHIVLGADIGTHSARLVAVTLSGEILASSKRGYSRRIAPGGIAEQDADDWWEAFRGASEEVVDLLGSKAEQIQALSIAHQRGTIVPVDTKGYPVRLALCDSDMRSGLSLDAEGRESERKWLYRRTGCPPVPFVGLGKILWVRTHEPDVYRQTVEWLTPHDYIVHKLSGEYVTSNAVALRVGVLDVEARGNLAEDVLCHYGLAPDSFPRVVLAGTAAGAVTKTASEMTGLKEGLPIIAGAGDQQCAIIANRLCLNDIAYVNLGTSFVVSQAVDRLVYDEDGLCTIEVLPQDKVYGPELGSGCGTNVFDWFRQELMRVDASSEQALWNDLSLQAASIPPGARGLVAIPRLWTAVGSSRAAGSIIGIDSSTSIVEMYRGIIEGLAYETRMSLERVERTSGANILELRAFGGATRNELLMQTLADVLNVPVAAGLTDASALGAAIVAASCQEIDCAYPDVLVAGDAMAGTGMGRRYSPDKTRASVYDALFHDTYVTTREIIESPVNSHCRICREESKI